MPMDQRFSRRHLATFDAKVTNLENPEHVASGRVVDISQEGVRLLLSIAFAPGAVVRIDIEASVLFGHVVYCQPEGPLSRIGIEVERVLLGTEDLSQLLQSVLMETMPATPGVLSSSNQSA
jgi:hypothetical protein